MVKRDFECGMKAVEGRRSLRRWRFGLGAGKMGDGWESADRGVFGNRSQFVTGCANFSKANRGILASSIRY
jgi:hypothetical protein